MKIMRTYRIPIESSSDNIDFIISNARYTNKVRNDFVENFKDRNPLGIRFNEIDDFKKGYFFNKEVVNNEYSKYVVGISEQVSKNLKNGLKIIKGKYKKYGILGSFHFKRFDSFRCSFKVHNLPYWTTQVSGNKYFYSRLKFLSDSKIIFRVRDGYWKEFNLNMKAYSSIETKSNGIHKYYNRDQNCSFTDEDIKEVVFQYNCGKCYILLVVYLEYDLCDYDKNNMCSIDLGIQNPGVLYYRNTDKNTDKDSDYYIIKMNNRTLNRVFYLERRARKLQKVMDMKMSINKIRYEKKEIPSVYTKNYNKLRRKFRITWENINNVKINWRKQTAAKIAKSFNIVITDPFNQPRKVKNKRLNYASMFYGMYYFNEDIKSACGKYHSTYIKSPSNTTRTCSKCGFLNKRLALSTRTFKCEKCGYERNRDMNAARNGFNIVFHQLKYL